MRQQTYLSEGFWWGSNSPVQQAVHQMGTAPSALTEHQEPGHLLQAQFKLDCIFILLMNCQQSNRMTLMVDIKLCMFFVVFLGF